jgi:hypothetical protein
VRHGYAARNPVGEVERPIINRDDGATLAFSKAQARKVLDAPPEAESGAGGADPLHDVQHVFERARQPVELPDNDHVALAQLVEHAVQLGPVPAPAGGGFFENAAAAGGAQRLRLDFVALLAAFLRRGRSRSACPDFSATFALAYYFE